MNDAERPTEDANSAAPAGLEASWALARDILRVANLGLTRIEFMREISRRLLAFSGADAIEVRLKGDDLHYLWEMTARRPDAPVFKVLSPEAGPLPDPRAASIIVLPLAVNSTTSGLLALKSDEAARFSAARAAEYAGLAESIGLAIANRRAQAGLRERLKELSCLYDISRIVRESTGSIGATLDAIVRLMPSAWQFPDMAGARILLGDSRHVDGDRSGARHIQSVPIIADGVDRGVVEVFYTGDRPEFVEGPFLPEEQSLIESIAVEIGRLVERTDAARRRKALEEQLRHADRLATIGELAAGVAHELNEPLANILGFAQLTLKTPDLPAQCRADIQHIVDATLHGREIIRNLLLFARQTPTTRAVVDVDTLAGEGLAILAARFAKCRIELRRDLAAGGERVFVDPSQFKQVIINLVVNAIQAMPDGGILTIRTGRDEGVVTLSVSDTGVGMSDDVRRRIFEPFFTTKDVGEGTGLGLAVVHGIVTAHDGTISVMSERGRGSTFEVRLPRWRGDAERGQ